MSLKDVDLPTSIDPSIDLEQARAESLDMIKKPAYISAGAAIVPIPFFDLVVDVGVLSVLLPKINEKFGLHNAQLSVYNARTGKVDWSAVTKRATELSGFVLTRTAVRAGMNGIVTKFVSKQVSKFIPLGGSLVAGSLGYLIMKKVAESHIEECYTTAKRIRAAQKNQGQTIESQEIVNSKSDTDVKKPEQTSNTEALSLGAVASLVASVQDNVKDILNADDKLATLKAKALDIKQDISHTFHDAKQQVDEKLDDVKATLDDKVEQVKEQAQDVAEHVNEKISQDDTATKLEAHQDFVIEVVKADDQKVETTEPEKTLADLVAEVKAEATENAQKP